MPADPTDALDLTHHRSVVNDVRLHYVTAGDEADPLVLLLHGFPEFWYSWREQIPALAEAGYRVVAPDLRGYNRSGKPEGVDAYHVERVVADVTGLVESLGGDPVRLVGHDWGGVIAWETAMRHPELLDRLVVLNAPHRGALAREATSSEQLLRSWYVFLFGLPRVPEWVLRVGDYRWIRWLLGTDPEREDAFTPEEIERYVSAASRPGALTAMVNYYRAAFRAEFGDFARQRAPFVADPEGRVSPSVDVPTMVVWGERDSSLSTALADGLDEWVADVRVERLPEAGHWVQNEAPDRVSELLVEHLAEE